MASTASVLALVGSISTGAYFMEDRYEASVDHQQDVIAGNQYIEQRFTDERIRSIQRQLSSISNKARHIPQNEYDIQQEKFLKEELNRERDNAIKRGLRY